MGTKIPSLLVGLLLSALSAASMASEETVSFDFGHREVPEKADRTIEVKIGDLYFEPSRIDVRNGETVRFILKNEGLVLHEFNLGTSIAHLEHQKEMVEMFKSGYLTAMKVNDAGHGMTGMEGNMHGMNHSDTNSVLIEPGQTKELVWTFSSASGIQFACNIPGHYQKGMVGQIAIK
ncbi:plastocyanin/azurin family copper-binding protein [Pseudomonas sp. DCA-1]|uniref:cupredoxin domain-containing protein n=1 Tax=Pseudomonas sp. DCA-1 TaxID=3344874 RepID=UPI0039774439